MPKLTRRLARFQDVRLVKCELQTSGVTGHCDFFLTIRFLRTTLTQTRRQISTSEHFYAARIDFANGLPWAVNGHVCQSVHD
jgi:hypothetical protein